MSRLLPLIAFASVAVRRFLLLLSRSWLRVHLCLSHRDEMV